MKGQMVQTQFTLTLMTSDGINTPISLTGYHTKSSMLIQLMGQKTDAKIKNLNDFVNGTLVKIVRNVEKSTEHATMKKILIEKFSQGCKTGDEMLSSIAPKIAGMTVDGDMGVHGNGNPNREPPCDEEAGNISDTSTFINENIVIEPPSTVGLAEADADKNVAVDEKTTRDDSKDIVVEEVIKPTDDATVAPDGVKDNENTEKDKHIKSMMIKLDEEAKEKKKLSKEIDQMRKKMKEMEAKDKLIAQSKDKLERMTKLRDQMSAAALTLKQKNEVLVAQQETHSATIKSQQETIQSYSAIININEAKMSEKDGVISDLSEKVKQMEIEIETHKDVAYRFMEAIDDDKTEYPEEMKSTKELERVYQRMAEEEKKAKKYEEDIKLLKSNIDELTEKLMKTDNTTKEMEESLKKKLEEKTQQYDEEKKKSKRELKQLKDALNLSEKAASDLKEKLRRLEEQMADDTLSKQIQKISQMDSQTNTEEDGEKAALIIENNEIKKIVEQLQEQLVTERTEIKASDTTKKSVAELSKIIQEKEADLIESSQFMENKLVESEKARDQLKSMLKEKEKQVDNLQNTIKSGTAKNKVVEEELQKLKEKCLSSREEIKQLVYLNSQLKGRIGNLQFKPNDEPLDNTKEIKIKKPKEIK